MFNKNTKDRNEHITEEPETNAERRERELFEQLTPAQQQQYIATLLRQFDSITPYFERKLED